MAESSFGVAPYPCLADVKKFGSISHGQKSRQRGVGMRMVDG